MDLSQDGVEQIAAALEGRENVDAIHILSHGNQGELLLGTGRLNAQTMQGEYADELATIRDALSEDGDILIYGCDFSGGVIGQQAAELLSELTSADIAASDDDTGYESLGGDWDLETQIGIINVDSIQVVNWEQLMAPIVVTLVAGPAIRKTSAAAGGNPPTTSAAAIGTEAVAQT